MNRRPRILLPDDITMLLSAFRRLLEPRCEIVGTAGDGRALVDLAASTRPEIVVLDVSMPGLNGIEACVQLRRRMPEVKLIFLTVNEDPDLATWLDEASDRARHVIHLGDIYYSGWKDE